MENLWKIVGICSLPLLIGGCEKKVEEMPEQEVFQRHYVECYTGNLIIGAEFAEDEEGKCKRKRITIYADNRNTKNNNAIYGLARKRVSDNPGWAVKTNEPWVKCDRAKVWYSKDAEPEELVIGEAGWHQSPIDMGKSRLLLGEECGIVPDEDKEAK